MLFSLSIGLLFFAIMMILLSIPCQISNIDCGFGSCSNGLGNYQCNCAEGAFNINMTESLPCKYDFCFGINCVNGKCTSGDDYYECLCNSGYKPGQIENNMTKTCEKI